jgi:hypothetical protein
MLDALSSAALDRTASQNANEWAKNVPAYSSSPSNLINLGESPPIPPYEDRLGWSPREQRGIQNGYVPSASPPSKRRPLSYNLDGNFAPSFDDHRSQISSYAARRSSMYSQHPRYAQHPPLPHQNQAHFYGAPDVNLMLSPPTPGLIPGDNGYFCGFDSLGSYGTISLDANKFPSNVVVSGYEGGVKIYNISKRGLTKVAAIDGLRGGVYNAKILPWTRQVGDSHKFPLIAMVIHGPVSSSSDASSGEGGTPPSEAVSIAQNESIRGSPRFHGMNDTDLIDCYQTTVEVYSLATNEHIATLLSVPKVHLSVPMTSPLFKPPPPVGTLTIRAETDYIVVASGTTGETWLFTHTESASENLRCIGKVWTTVQHGVTDLSTHAGQPDDWHATESSTARKQYKASILSMNGKWLAYCPPTPSSQTSLRAAVPAVNSTARIPGLNSHAPPQLPSVNCSIDMPDGESMMKQLVQISTQKFIEAGNYLTQQGLQAWNNYRNKPAANQPNGTAPYPNHSNIPGQFPPTHGLPTPAPLVTKDPGIISILDLNLLAHHSSTGSTPHPLASFRVPHGCSFLSFAPSGLALFTASSKGDVQFVWDLLRIQYSKSSFLKGGLQTQSVTGPHVRQIAQFSRMTIARVVDVVWTSPHGERAAMVTEPGTVHILDLPASAFTWPPPRRRNITQKQDEAIGDSTPLTASSVATSAVNTIWTAARPLVSRRRRSSAGISARMVTAQAGHGTQALAAGISRSVGAATGKMNEMRKSGTTKLHLPRSSAIPSRNCALLANGKRNDSVIVLAGGVVRIYTINNRRADRPADRQKASRGAKYVEYRIPSLPDFKFPPDFTRDIPPIGDLELTERDIEESRWKARQASPPAPLPHGTESSIPQAEIESNAPYQPFHTDRRVALHIFSYEEGPMPSPSVSALLSPELATLEKAKTVGQLSKAWAFGGPIKSKKLDIGPPHNPDDDFDLPFDHRALPSSAIERVMRVTDSTEEVEQIVITTRRRKGASRNSPDGTGDGDEEGFFEDDCEVLDFASQRV